MSNGSGPAAGKDLGDQVEDLAARAGDHPALEGAARVGYAVNGVLHLVLAWICVQLAMLHQIRDADQSGALAALASSGMGRFALWLGVVGLGGLVLWQLTETLVPGLHDDWKDRLKDGSKVVVYAVLCWTCLTFARGGESSGKARTRELTTTVMSGYAGRLLVGLVGLTLVGIAAYHVHKGLTKKFLRDLDRHPGDLAVRAGMIGYPTRGLAIGTVGLLFVGAAIDNSTARTDGLDAALRVILDQPYGRVMTALMAVGFAAFGVYLFFRARHADV